MKMVNVQSSNLDSVDYDEESETLIIKFRNGGIYKYFGVPKNIYLNLINAPSKGKYFHNFIKDIYKYQKIN